jgi:hypothetical protein
MDIMQWEDLDRIMRYLYKNRQGVAWHTVYTTLEMEASYANSLYEIAKADGYVKVEHKGFNVNTRDPHFVKLTDSGLAFFARGNYLEEHNKKHSPQIGSVVNNTNITNSSNGIIVSGNNNTSNISINGKKKPSFSKNPWLITVLGGLILAVIIYIIKSLGIGL